MATITLGTLRDYWKAIKDWVDGTDAVSAPKVTAQLTGSNFEQADTSALPTKAAVIAANNAGNAQIPRTAYADSQTGGTILEAAAGGWNGIGIDRWRNNTEGTLLASAARTAQTISADQTNYNARGVILILDVTAVTATPPNLTVTIGMKDPVSGGYPVLTRFAAVAAGVSQFSFVLYPGAKEDIAVPGTPLEAQGLPLPRTWRVDVDPSSAESVTYSLGYLYIL